ncbi:MULTISPECIES: N-acetyltransferase [unclassified Rhizobium]|jgi:putative acetyltransferase|uniref:GNAT family N-acetyltransferase n=1 Tax=unclassified Rhizobium TaxID=2613769 RepID=UPI000648CAB3|nr:MULTISPECIES: N-acetyltransferase [unclassified Rhizobium]MBN8950441.1 N-acetyltransferase [Rhizobium tropici]OJY68964.1 MAG: GNAT family N-acetyltransferase [Rhizobium sp. 60-20]RKD74260.1 putative acetyltransferase [Rhizobium sp. WW_1]
MEIRLEEPKDAEAIRRITKAAFASIEHSSQTEAEIIDALRSAGALTISLVATEEADVIGHIAFSPVMIEGEHLGWYGLGPVSVAPDHQKKGIGALLIREGLSRLAKAGAKGCVVLGEPDYYKRFGFENDPGLVLEGVPAEYFMRLVLDGSAPSGRVDYHQGFNAS